MGGRGASSGTAVMSPHEWASYQYVFFDAEIEKFRMDQYYQMDWRNTPEHDRKQVAILRAGREFIGTQEAADILSERETQRLVFRVRETGTTGRWPSDPVSAARQLENLVQVKLGNERPMFMGEQEWISAQKSARASFRNLKKAYPGLTVNKLTALVSYESHIVRRDDD